jgi:hypothetical protein
MPRKIVSAGASQDLNLAVMILALTINACTEPTSSFDESALVNELQCGGTKVL